LLQDEKPSSAWQDSSSLLNSSQQVDNEPDACQDESTVFEFEMSSRRLDFGVPPLNRPRSRATAATRRWTVRRSKARATQSEVISSPLLDSTATAEVISSPSLDSSTASSEVISSPSLDSSTASSEVISSPSLDSKTAATQVISSPSLDSKAAPTPNVPVTVADTFLIRLRTRLISLTV